jgi:RNA recognition motif-containing protein
MAPYHLTPSPYPTYSTSTVASYSQPLYPTPPIPGMMAPSPTAVRITHIEEYMVPPTYAPIVPTLASPSMASFSIPPLPPEPYFTTEARRVHINKLPRRVREPELRGLIVQTLPIYGHDIEKVDLHNIHKSYALVTFSRKELASMLVDKLNGVQYDGHTLVVKIDTDYVTTLPERSRQLSPEEHPGGHTLSRSSRKHSSIHPSKSNKYRVSNRQNQIVNTEPPREYLASTSSYSSELEASYDQTLMINTEPIPEQRQIEKRSPSCPSSVCSSREEYLSDTERYPPRPTALSLVSPAIVDGSKSRLLESPPGTPSKSSKGSNSKSKSRHEHSRKDHGSSSSGKRSGENSKGKKR